VARVELSATAIEDLDRLIVTHSLPDDTRARVGRSLRQLQDFPLLGRALGGRWSGFRFILGPWRWLLVVYVHDETEDLVLVVTILDARSSGAATTRR
jgi:plasmid stabilization system protein ParE